MTDKCYKLKSMRKIQLIFIILCYTSIIKAQFNIQGRVIDSSNGKGIEFAIVQKEDTNVGCISDSSGSFALNNLKYQPDSLLFSCIGYESKKLYLKQIDISKPLQITLKPKVFELKEVIIKPLNKSLWIGDKGHTNKGVPLYYASQETRYFKSEYSPSYIKSFWFYLNETCGNNQKVRICIYNADTIANFPMEDILQTNLIKNNLKKGWNKIDLSNLKISVPTNGFFIGLESIAAKDDCCKVKSHEDQRIITYHSLVIGCGKEPTVCAKKSLFFADYEINGELQSRKMSNDWHNFGPLKGFDLLYRVEIMY